MPIEEDLQNAKQLLEASARPLFLHDDDCDGVSCFVMMYQWKKDGKGVCVKKTPVVTEMYVRKVEEYQPDLIVVMDKPEISEEFLEQVSTPILWIDHHAPQDVSRYGHVTYVNPRVHDDKDNRPTSYWVYLLTQTNLWMAMVGNVGDWFIPPFIDEFQKQYPDLLPESFETVEQLYLHSRLGELIKILQFNLKGSITDVRKSILTLTRIESPYEILNQTSSRGRFIYKKYKRLASAYNRHVERACKVAEQEGPFLLYEYGDDMTFTSELSNELLVRFPEKVIVVSRSHDNKRKCSLRTKEISLPEKIEEAMKGLEGHGGGHTNACGLVVSEEDWPTFWERLTELIAS